MVLRNSFGWVFKIRNLRSRYCPSIQSFWCSRSYFSPNEGYLWTKRAFLCVTFGLFQRAKSALWLGHNNRTEKTREQREVATFSEVMKCKWKHPRTARTHPGPSLTTGGARGLEFNFLLGQHSNTAPFIQYWLTGSCRATGEMMAGWEGYFSPPPANSQWQNCLRQQKCQTEIMLGCYSREGKWQKARHTPTPPARPELQPEASQGLRVTREDTTFSDGNVFFKLTVQL